MAPPCADAELANYFLIEYDLIRGRAGDRASFFCAQLGKEYTTLVNNKRCSQSQ